MPKVTIDLPPERKTRRQFSRTRQTGVIEFVENKADLVIRNKLTVLPKARPFLHTHRR